MILPAFCYLSLHETCGLIFFLPFLKQKLLEEIENNKDKVDECQKYAKAYIDTIKVSKHQYFSVSIVNTVT